MKSDREYLLDAAGIIETRGHCKCALENSDGNVCLRGALCVAAAGDPYAFSAKADELLGAVGKRLGLNWQRTINWNNDEERTASEVIAALRETAESLNEQNGVGGV